MKTFHRGITVVALAALSFQVLAGPPPGKGKQDQLATFDMIASGSVTSDVTCEDDPNADGFLGCKKQLDGSTIDVTLGDYFVNRVYDNGAQGTQCFANGPTFSGTIQLADEQQGEDRAVYRFVAFAADGETEVAYVLTFSDPHIGWDNGFPPEADAESTLYSTHWSLGTYNRDKKYGPCNGSGAFQATDMVTVDLYRHP